MPVLALGRANHSAANSANVIGAMRSFVGGCHVPASISSCWRFSQIVAPCRVSNVRGAAWVAPSYFTRA